MKAEIVFLEIAKNDLEASRWLFERKLHPQAIFYLEQSSEKAVKSLGIWKKAITVKEAERSIGHKALKVYFKIFEKSKDTIKSVQQTIEGVLLTFPKLRESSLAKLFTDKSQVEVLERNTEEIQRILFDSNATFEFSSQGDILDAILSRIDRLKFITESAIRRAGDDVNSSRLDIKKLERHRKDFHEIFEAHFRTKGIAIEQGNKTIDEAITPDTIALVARRFKQSMRLNLCYESLYYLCLLLYPHSSRSRYPNDDFNPTQYYQEGLPLVQKFKAFMDVVECILGYLARIYASGENES